MIDNAYSKASNELNVQLLNLSKSAEVDAYTKVDHCKNIFSYINTYFPSITINKKIVYLISFTNKCPLLKSKTPLSLFELVSEANSLKKARSWILNAETFAYSLMSQKSHKAAKLLNSIIDYLKSLYFCTQRIEVLYKRSKKTKKKPGYFLEYCCLCWRLINRDEILDSVEETSPSKFYCPVHHSSRSEHLNKKAKAALISAIKGSSYAELIDEYKSRKEENRVNPRFLYTSLNYFAQKPYNVDGFMTPEMLELKNKKYGFAWNIGIIKEKCRKAYPFTYNKLIQNNAFLEIETWEGFFFNVISILDPTGTDSRSWSNDSSIPWRSMTNEQAVDNFYCGDKTLLMIIHRHEAFSTIERRDRRRGTKAGTVPINIDRRNQIIEIVKQHKKNGQKIKGVDIANQLDISAQRVSVLLKRLNLSLKHINKVIRDQHPLPD